MYWMTFVPFLLLIVLINGMWIIYFLFLVVINSVVRRYIWWIPYRYFWMWLVFFLCVWQYKFMWMVNFPMSLNVNNSMVKNKNGNDPVFSCSSNSQCIYNWYFFFYLSPFFLIFVDWLSMCWMVTNIIDQ